MKLSKTFSTVIIIVSIAATTAFAAADTSISYESKENSGNIASHFKDHNEKNFKEFNKDPIKSLENRKEKIQTMLKEGKITKEKADKITAKINTKIKEIQDFEKLTLPQKKEKLINDFKSKLEERVKEGKIDKSQAVAKLKEFSQEVEKWDGKDGFKFFKEQFKGKHKHYEKE